MRRALVVCQDVVLDRKNIIIIVIIIIRFNVGLFLLLATWLLYTAY